MDTNKLALFTTIEWIKWFAAPNSFLNPLQAFFPLIIRLNAFGDTREWESSECSFGKETGLWWLLRSISLNLCKIIIHEASRSVCEREIDRKGGESECVEACFEHFPQELPQMHDAFLIYVSPLWLRLVIPTKGPSQQSRRYWFFPTPNLQLILSAMWSVFTAFNTYIFFSIIMIH